MRFIALFDAMRRRAVCNSNLEFRVDIRLFDDHRTIWTATTAATSSTRQRLRDNCVPGFMESRMGYVTKWGVHGWNFASKT